MKRIYILLFVFFVAITGGLQALKSQDSKRRNIIETLSSTDSVSQATVRIYQDRRIEQLVTNKRNSAGSRQTASGYRVQVFSSNVQRTAKAEAFRIERQIREEFADQSVYVNYFSPFWKVRVGDFRTQAQAQAFRNELINAFPQMRSEIYIVREQILLSAPK
jgi:hypothetical protein